MGGGRPELWLLQGKWNDAIDMVRKATRKYAPSEINWGDKQKKWGSPIRRKRAGKRGSVGEKAEGSTQQHPPKKKRGKENGKTTFV